MVALDVRDHNALVEGVVLEIAIVPFLLLLLDIVCEEASKAVNWRRILLCGGSGCERCGASWC